MANPKKYENYFTNYINPNLEIRMTKDKGRGVFAIKPIKKGDLIFTEKPIATGNMEVNSCQIQITDIRDSINAILSDT